MPWGTYTQSEIQMIHQLTPETLSNRLYGTIHTPSLPQIEQAFPNTPVWALEDGFDSVLGGMVETINKAMKETGKQP